MAYQPLEELLPKADFSIYRLVRLASKRALEISETGANLISAPLGQKIATTALEEIRYGKVYDQSGVHNRDDNEPKQVKPRKSK
jgi:DNA-directed RNA polymerase omega subunit